MKKILTLISFLALFGCVDTINQRSEINHAQTAYSAQTRGDWDTARRHWAKAVVNANLANEPDEKLAILNYEYGRSLGVTCFFDESEKYLNTAYELDKKTNGPSYNDLIELARLNLDQKKWDKAINYFDKAMPELERVNAETKAPHAYADILADYAKALEGLNRSESAEYSQRAENIRKDNPQGHSITDRTPYGTQCTN